MEEAKIYVLGDAPPVTGDAPPETGDAPPVTGDTAEVGKMSRQERRRLEREAEKARKKGVKHLLPSEFRNAASSAMRAGQGSGGALSLTDVLSRASDLTEALQDVTALNDMSEADATRAMLSELLSMIPNKNAYIPVDEMLANMKMSNMPEKAFGRLKECVGNAKNITAKQFKKYIKFAMTGS